MEERNLITLLLFIGVTCLIIITFSDFLIQSSITKIGLKFIPLVLCEKDKNGTYILASYSLESCRKILEMGKFENLCLYYGENKKEACLNLINIAEERGKNCIIEALKGNLTINLEINDSVKKNCDILLS